jgi:hypothetical protein
MSEWPAVQFILLGDESIIRRALNEVIACRPYLADASNVEEEEEEGGRGKREWKFESALSEAKLCETLDARAACRWSFSVAPFHRYWNDGEEECTDWLLLGLLGR